MENAKSYLMSIIMVCVAGAQAVIAAATDGFAQDEKVIVAIAVATAVSVYVVPNVPQWPWMKSGVGALLVGLNLGVQFLIGGMTPEEWLMIAVAVLGALGLLVTPNRISRTDSF